MPVNKAYPIHPGFADGVLRNVFGIDRGSASAQFDFVACEWSVVLTSSGNPAGPQAAAPGRGGRRGDEHHAAAGLAGRRVPAAVPGGRASAGGGKAGGAVGFVSNVRLYLSTRRSQVESHVNPGPCKLSRKFQSDNLVYA